MSSHEACCAWLFDGHPAENKRQPWMQRLAYFPQEAAKELSKYSLLLAVDARLPVAMFGYK